MVQYEIEDISLCVARDDVLSTIGSNARVMMNTNEPHSWFQQCYNRILWSIPAEGDAKHVLSS